MPKLHSAWPQPWRSSPAAHEHVYLGVPTLRSCIKFLAASVQRFPACARCCSTLPMGSWSMTISACSPSFSAFCRISTAGQQREAVSHRTALIADPKPHPGNQVYLHDGCSTLHAGGLPHKQCSAACYLPQVCSPVVCTALVSAQYVQAGKGTDSIYPRRPIFWCTSECCCLVAS